MLQYSISKNSTSKEFYVTLEKKRQKSLTDMREFIVKIKDSAKDIENNSVSLLLESANAISLELGSSGIYSLNGELCCSVYAPPVDKSKIGRNTTTSFRRPSSVHRK
jgi:hypothetical protein